MTFEIQKLVDVMRATAAAEILPRFGRLAENDIRTKSEATDLVTEADEAAERFLRREITGLMPHALFVGEESAASDPSLLKALPEAELAVVVDPIDGTANFVAGMPLFNVVVAITRRGEAIAGIIYDPITDSYAVAETGSGAFLQRSKGDRSPLRVAEPVPLPEMFGYVAIGDLTTEMKPGVLANLAKPRMFAGQRCASHEYRALAAGHAHFAMYHILNPWDHLAGTLIATEAGAHSARPSGLPYDVSARRDTLLTATDPDSWNVLMQSVFTAPFD